jgi:hypothetical protein
MYVHLCMYLMCVSSVGMHAGRNVCMQCNVRVNDVGLLNRTLHHVYVYNYISSHVNHPGIVQKYLKNIMLVVPAQHS